MTAVNSQITDAVTQANVKVLAEAPAMAMGSLYQTMAYQTALLTQNPLTAMTTVCMNATADFLKQPLMR